MATPAPIYPGQPPSNVKTALAGGALAALLVSNIYLFVQIHDLKTDAAKARENVQAQIETLKESTTVVSTTSRQHINNLREELDRARRQGHTEAVQAKSEALSHSEQLARRLEKEQQRDAQKFSGEISQVKEVAASATTKLADVTGDVTNVKNEVASTKSELSKTNENLKKVTGDLGLTSGYVATNSKELSELKRRGERNYFEFRLAKAKQPQHVADVALLLKKADPKHNRFTLEVMADDKKTEKKDRGVNEPVQFYGKPQQLYEIVVNEVRKDQVVGYLVTPKYQSARN